VVEKHGVKIVGPANLAAELATDASALFARNLLNFITPMVDKETKALKIDTNDEVVKGTLVTAERPGRAPVVGAVVIVAFTSAVIPRAKPEGPLRPQERSLPSASLRAGACARDDNLAFASFGSC